ncbi:hypothetical protein AGMMS49949_05060 [Alphaproteobacteria bacterium]|nr:hypothetical protein AGMMS49949_05060 [Alphaproteobacteria bacterium]
MRKLAITVLGLGIGFCFSEMSAEEFNKVKRTCNAEELSDAIGSDVVEVEDGGVEPITGGIYS